MQKVCLKIPGVAKPHSIMGKRLFEDERYLVIADGNIHRKIPWDNILYIEEVVGLEQEEPTPQPPLPPQAPPPEPPAPPPPSEILVDAAAKPKRPRVPYEDLRQMAQESRERQPQTQIQLETAQRNRVNGAPTNVVPGIEQAPLVTAQVFFEGHKEGVFQIDGVPSNLLHGNWTPELSRHIFSNEQVRGFMGGFNVEKMYVANGNVYIKNRSVEEELIKPIEEKMKMIGEVQARATKLNEIEQKRFERPSMKLDTTFGMTADPFDAPVSLGGNDPQIEEVPDVGSGEEASISETKDS